jgi:hypothetical protein
MDSSFPSLSCVGFLSADVEINLFSLIEKCNPLKGFYHHLTLVMARNIELAEYATVGSALKWQKKTDK